MISNPKVRPAKNCHRTKDLNLILVKPESPVLLEPSRLYDQTKKNDSSTNFYSENVKYISNNNNNNRRKQLTPSEYNKIMRMTIGYVLAFFMLIIVTFCIVYFV